ncbi:MAG: DUF3800 domain-containing protein [Erysipelotrichaceae bacterium]|nr:DUF3800 domain-containing protein [Erysipelotrichaceae bacterium]
MKYLYIDESLDENLFVVGGILVDNEQDMLLAYRQFKKSIDSIPMTRKQKERITHEFNASLLDKSFPQIKRKLLYKLNVFDCKVVYASANKHNIKSQKEKEKTYIHLLSRIIEIINEDVIVVTFDSFGNARFERDIISAISNYKNVSSIRNDLSFNNKGLQFADNVCGVIRKHLSGNDADDFYKIIESMTINAN